MTGADSEPLAIVEHVEVLAVHLRHAHLLSAICQISLALRGLPVVHSGIVLSGEARAAGARGGGKFLCRCASSRYSHDFSRFKTWAALAEKSYGWVD